MERRVRPGAGAAASTWHGSRPALARCLAAAIDDAGPVTAVDLRTFRRSGGPRWWAQHRRTSRRTDLGRRSAAAVDRDAGHRGPVLARGRRAQAANGMGGDLPAIRRPVP